MKPFRRGPSRARKFYVVALPAWKIENGKIDCATNAVKLAGNIFQMLQTFLPWLTTQERLGN